MISTKGWRYLGLTPPRQAQPADLFNAGAGDV
jgi:holliday junction DNA helicase RuvB